MANRYRPIGKPAPKFADATLETEVSELGKGFPRDTDPGAMRSHDLPLIEAFDSATVHRTRRVLKS